jgi:uncharacterized protein (DUF1684 family)
VTALVHGLHYFDHDPAYRVDARVEPGDGSELVIDTGGEDGAVRYRRAGRLVFNLGGQECRLTVLSLVQYAGGLFVPFRDRTSGHETYGGGRYLFDTAKNTDGLVRDQARLSGGGADFNYAYTRPARAARRWACPLAPPEPPPVSPRDPKQCSWQAPPDPRPERGSMLRVLESGTEPCGRRLEGPAFRATPLARV